MKILIDTSKYSFKKYNDKGEVDYISPIPFLVNYGSCLDTIGEDGDRIDAIVLGKRLNKGYMEEFDKKGKIIFIDNGEEDTKFIFKNESIVLSDKIVVFVFFNAFAIFKLILNKLRGKNGKTGIVKIIFNS